MKISKIILTLVLGLPIFKLSGATYFLRSSGGAVSTTTSWVDVSGAASGGSPANFTTVGDVFVIDALSGAATYSAAWTLAGTLDIQSGTRSFLKSTASATAFSIGGLIVASGASLELGGTKMDLTLNGNITNGGTITIRASNSFTFGSTTITNSGTISTAQTLTFAVGTTLNNSGTITTTAATPFTDSRSSKSYGGTVDLSSSVGGQTILTGFTFNNLTLSNTSGTNTLNALATVTVGGTLTVTNANMYLILNGGTLTVNSFAGSGALTGSSTSSVVYTGGTNSTMLMNITNPGTTNRLDKLTLNSNTNLTLGTALQISTTLTIAADGTLAMGNNTLSVTTTLSNSGKISTTCPTATSATPLSLPAGTWGGTIEYASTSAQTVIGGTYTNLTLSGAGTKTLGSTVTVIGILTTAGGKLTINTSGLLSLTGQLSGVQCHVIGASIECNGGDFSVTGKKDQGTDVPPYMKIASSITDISNPQREGCIQFLPSNAGNPNDKTVRSVIRFVGSSISIGSTQTTAGSVPYNRSITANQRAYFEIGDGTTTTSLTLNDTITLFNGIRLRSSSTFESNNMLKLGTCKLRKYGASYFNGFMDTVDASSPTPVFNGDVTLIETIEISRKFRFLGNPFTSNLSITDFTDDIDITGSIGTNTNNFTATQLNAPSAFVYNTTGPSWTAVTSSNPTVLAPLQGLRVLVRGSKGEGLTGGSYTQTTARIQISGAPYLGDKTISNLSYDATDGTKNYHFITNPLLAPIELDSVGDGATGISTIVNVYLPSSSGYKAYDFSTKTFTGGGDPGNIWLPGTSVFFQTTASTNSIVVRDRHKIEPNKRSYRTYFAELDSFKNIGNLIVSNAIGRESLADGVALDFGNRKEAKDGYDVGIDGVDFGSDSVNLSLITPEGKYLAISKTNGLIDNEIRRYPLLVTTRNSSLNGDYSFTFEQFKSFEAGYQVILLDKLLNVSTDLLTMPKYDFKISDDVNSKGDNRFEIIVAKSQLGLTDIVNEKSIDCIVYQDGNEGTIRITTIGNSPNQELIIFDVQGKQLYKNSSCNVIIPSEKFKPGVYFACVKSGEIRKTKKFIITN